MIANADGTPVLGILMLDTRFPRVAGDVGNPATWPFPTRIAVVRGASPQRVVTGRAAGLADAFVASGRDLVAAGATALITTCGFLVLHQRELARATFPVGGLAKAETSAHAVRFGLPVADKPDSQDLCFAPSADHGAFLVGRAPDLVRPGEVVDADGRVLGVHDGSEPVK